MLYSLLILICFQFRSLKFFFLLLTSFLFIICGLICWEFSNENFLIFSLLSNWIHLSLILTFSSINLLSFFFFFEMSIWRYYVFTFIWFPSRKTHAAYYFFMYTSLGSIFILNSFSYDIYIKRYLKLVHSLLFRYFICPTNYYMIIFVYRVCN
jgi:NADH:ubiquinone oxidoreductase subunit 4 (subunit M)